MVRDRVWFFTGYQHLRDYDSQPGTDPSLPRTYEQDKVFAKLTWRLAPGLQLVQSYHNEFWVNPELRDVREAIRSDATPARVRASHDLRPPHPHVVIQNRVGRSGRPVRVHSRGRPEHRRCHDPQPVRPRDGRLQRRAANVRRAQAHSHDRQGDRQSLSAGAARRRSPVEVRRTGRKRRAPAVHDHSDRCQVRRQSRRAVSVGLQRSFQSWAACSSPPPDS